ncbi:hypothetical protein O6H91_04G008800 [Diphasiastrum complanatum]|uniref:Uncharacterized protein n=1 Tax=Diphasiastrum complanatum TaxID=34168 RepID=A0ACC2DUC5_DIPCM|nr:hypothetical protein O6H91_04G008800 [Diphasiastrum complanatum]
MGLKDLFYAITVAHRARNLGVSDDPLWRVHVEPSRVVVVESAQMWQELLKRAHAQKTIIVVHFSAEWCAPCKFIAPDFDQLSRKYPELIFLDLDVDEVKEVASKMNVKAMPTFMFIKEEEEADRFVGANKEELEKRICNLANSQT